MSNGKADIGLIGLAVMGENLILNMESKGFTVAAFNRTASKVDDFVNGRAKGKKIIGAHSIEELVSLLKRPRKVMLMVKAGKAVDDFIEQLLPAPRAGRHHHRRRQLALPGHHPPHRSYVEGKGLLYIGTGVSGGEEGALHGPLASCPAASPAAWPHVKPIFQAIAAKVADGTPCCDWVGEDGAGHFVKMVHNGIEYGDMQLICEAYHLMKDGLGHDAPTRCTRSSPSGTRASSTATSSRSPATSSPTRTTDGKPLVDKILDTAGQKGTGKWTVHHRARPGHPAHADRRGRLRPLPLRHEGRARRGLEDAAAGPTPTFTGDRQGVRRRPPPGALRLQDRLLRAGLHAACARRRRSTAGT